jgi:hypothetical protein
MHTKFLSENLKGRDHVEHLGVDAKTLEWILGKLGGSAYGLDSSSSRKGPVVDSYEQVNELSGSIKGRIRTKKEPSILKNLLPVVIIIKMRNKGDSAHLVAFIFSQ